MQVCNACNLEIANIMFDHLWEEIVVFFAPGEYAMNEINFSSFAQLDLVLAPHYHRECVKDCHSIRDYALASHHFLLVAHLNIELERRQDSYNNGNFQINVMRDP